MASFQNYLVNIWNSEKIKIIKKLMETRFLQFRYYILQNNKEAPS